MNPSDLRRMYDEAGSVSELARRLSVTNMTARKWLRNAGIATRKSGYRSPRTVPTPKGADHFNWKGGTYRHADGYIYEYAPDHPDASRAKGYVLQHRLVAERTLGRTLRSDELVHHINEIKDDNRPENLQVLDRSSHIIHHKEHADRDLLGRFV